MKKLNDKHVSSLRSRVINLRELLPSLTLPELKKALKAAFEKEYGSVAAALYEEDLNQALILETENKYGSEAWLYRHEKKYEFVAEEKFAWGLCRIEYDLKDSVIKDCALYTDAMDADHLSEVARLLKGADIRRLKEILTDEKHREIHQDIRMLLEKNL